jgi:tetraacyldisaccharide-1-P 4'-kinase
LTRAPDREVDAQLDALLQRYSAAPQYAVPFRTFAPRQVTNYAEFSHDEIAKYRLLAVVGIAQPQVFFHSLAEYKIFPVAELILRDHQVIAGEQLTAQSRELDGIITTAKDYYRDPAVFLACKKPVLIMDLAAELPFAQLKAHFPRMW